MVSQDREELRASIFHLVGRTCFSEAMTTFRISLSLDMTTTKHYIFPSTYIYIYTHKYKYAYPYT